MIIEKLKMEDISQVIELHKTLVPFEVSVDKAIKSYKEMLSNENYLMAAAKEGNEIIGAAMGIYCQTLSAPFLVIEDVIVKEGIRGRGIGGKLMEFLDEFAKSKDCGYAILISSGFRKEAHKFYEKHGFIDDVRGFRKVY